MLLLIMQQCLLSCSWSSIARCTAAAKLLHKPAENAPSSLATAHDHAVTLTTTAEIKNSSFVPRLRVCGFTVCMPLADLTDPQAGFVNQLQHFQVIVHGGVKEPLVRHCLPQPPAICFYWACTCSICTTSHG